jgi:hypothetical protein
MPTYGISFFKTPIFSFWVVSWEKFQKNQCKSSHSGKASNCKALLKIWPVLGSLPTPLAPLHAGPYSSKVFFIKPIASGFTQHIKY